MWKHARLSKGLVQHNCKIQFVLHYLDIIIIPNNNHKSCWRCLPCLGSKPYSLWMISPSDSTTIPVVPTTKPPHLVDNIYGVCQPETSPSDYLDAWLLKPAIQRGSWGMALDWKQRCQPLSSSFSWCWQLHTHQRRLVIFKDAIWTAMAFGSSRRLTRQLSDQATTLGRQHV